MPSIRLLIHLLVCLSLFPPAILGSSAGNDAEALLDFKKSLSNSQQLDRTWKQGTEPCKDQWEGVFCMKGKDVIIRLHLPRAGLSGKVDVKSLSRIKTLRTISLMNNSFEGEIPAFGTEMTGLRALYLSRNNFSGEIPADYFAPMRSLTRLWLSENRFSGPIPASVVKLPQLSQLHLENNEFSGRVPEMKQGSTLKEVNFSNNKLEGEVPQSMGRFGAKAFEGNEGVCGKAVGVDCEEIISGDNKSPSDTQSSFGIMVVLIVILGLLLLLTTVFRSNPTEEEFTRLKKPRVEDVVEVRVQGKGDAVAKTTRTRSRSGSGSGSSVGKISGGSGSNKAGSSHGKKKGGGGAKSGGMSDLVIVNDSKGTFGMADLMKAAAEVLGTGALGSAYKAVMAAVNNNNNNNGLSVVVKRIRDMNRLDRNEFDAEILRMARLRHPNVLTPLAYHYRKEEKLLISEFVSRGSLLYVLHGDRGLSHAGLNWPTRLKIIKGTASGMRFLLTMSTDSAGYCDLPPHGNLKASNVLLNENYDPLISDYGFLHLLERNQAAQGMFAFKAPELANTPTPTPTPKSDVYCLGILILELLTGKFPSQYLNAGKGGIDIVQWVRDAIKEGKETEILDPDIASICTPESIDNIVQLLFVGVDCTETSPDNRPTLEQAVRMIEDIQT